MCTGTDKNTRLIFPTVTLHWTSKLLLALAMFCYLWLDLLSLLSWLLSSWWVSLVPPVSLVNQKWRRKSLPLTFRRYHSYGLVRMPDHKNRNQDPSNPWTSKFSALSPARVEGHSNRSGVARRCLYGSLASRGGIWLSVEYRYTIDKLTCAELSLLLITLVIISIIPGQEAV